LPNYVVFAFAVLAVLMAQPSAIALQVRTRERHALFNDSGATLALFIEGRFHVVHHRADLVLTGLTLPAQFAYLVDIAQVDALKIPADALPFRPETDRAPSKNRWGSCSASNASWHEARRMPLDLIANLSILEVRPQAVCALLLAISSSSSSTSFAPT
jgi:hypothetical protein